MKCPMDSSYIRVLIIYVPVSSTPTVTVLRQNLVYIFESHFPTGSFAVIFLFSLSSSYRDTQQTLMAEYRERLEAGK